MSVFQLFKSGDADQRGLGGSSRIAPASSGLPLSGRALRQGAILSSDLSAPIRQIRGNPRLPLFFALAIAAVGAPALQAQPSSTTYFLVVSGAGGERAYKEQFFALGAALATAATSRLGIPAANVTFLAEDSARAPAAGRSSRAGVERAIAGIASRARGDDRVVVVLIGHGSATGGVSRFNLPGPDISAAEMKTLLAPLPARAVALVNTSSASGEWVAALSGPGRVVIAATRTGYEGNATTFPRYFVDALASDVADADKDGAVSLLEAFDYARREVARAFEADNRLLTEHAILDDDGDGKGTAQPANRGDGDGALARRIAFRSGAAATTSVAATSADPAARALYATRDSLQRQVESLRGRKGTMPEAQYERELEPLMVALARTNRAIRAREGAGAPPR
jgi:hypothetical protein